MDEAASSWVNAAREETSFSYGSSVAGLLSRKRTPTGANNAKLSIVLSVLLSQFIDAWCSERDWILHLHRTRTFSLLRFWGKVIGRERAKKKGEYPQPFPVCVGMCFTC